jgi:hypothetical protein
MYVCICECSVADIARRLAIIVAGAILFGKVLTPMNLLGIAVALSGVLSYSILLNLDQRRQQDQHTQVDEDAASAKKFS